MSIFPISSSCIWLVLFAIYFRYCDLSYPDCSKFDINKCGTTLNLALKFEQHWEYALKLASNILFALAGFNFLVNCVLYNLLINQILSDSLCHLFSTLVYFASLFFFCFVITFKLKKFN